MVAETPLRLNFAMMVAMERREAVKAFAAQKFSAIENLNDEERLADVVSAMFTIEA